MSGQHVDGPRRFIARAACIWKKSRVLRDSPSSVNRVLKGGFRARAAMLLYEWARGSPGPLACVPVCPSFGYASGSCILVVRV